MKKRAGIMENGSIKKIKSVGMLYLLTFSLCAFGMDAIHESTLLVGTGAQARDARDTIRTNSYVDVYHPHKSARDKFTAVDHFRLQIGTPDSGGFDDGLPSSPYVTTIAHEQFDDQGVEIEGGAAAIARTAHEGHERKSPTQPSSHQSQISSDELEIVLERLQALLDAPDLSAEDAVEIREKIDFFSQLLRSEKGSQREVTTSVKSVQPLKRPGYIQRIVIQRAARTILKDPEVEIAYINLTGGTGIQGHPKFCSFVTQTLVAQLRTGALPFELFSVVKSLIDQSEIFKKSISVSGLQVHDAVIRGFINHQKDTIRKLISAVIRVMREKKLTTKAMQAVEKLSDEQMKKWQNLEGKDEEVDENDTLYEIEPFYDATEQHDQQIEENDLAIEKLFVQLGLSIQECLNSRGQPLVYKDLSPDVQKKVTDATYGFVRIALMHLSTPGTDEMIMSAQQEAIETLQRILARRKSVVIQTVPNSMSFKVIRN